MNCLICSLPLETENEQLRTVHFSCDVCSLCNHAGLQLDRILECVKNAYDVSHLTCWNQKIEAELQQRPVTVTQAHLDYLNNCRLLVSPDLTRSVEQNQADADRALTRHVVDMSIDEQYILLKRLQSTCATMSILLRNNQEQMNVKIRREITYEERLTRDRKLLADVEHGRESEQKQLERKRERATPEGKAIKALMAIGLSEDQARESLKQGKKEAIN